MVSKELTHVGWNVVDVLGVRNFCRVGRFIRMVCKNCKLRMIDRFFYALKMGWFHRNKLKQYSRDPRLQIETVLQLDPSQLKSEGIEALAIDFDGVLSVYGEDCPSPHISTWLNSCLAIFGREKVFILSNNPTKLRQKCCNDLGITLIRNVKKKPFPEGLLKIIKETQVKPASLLLIDDRLLTGILAAEIVGISAKWVTKPYIGLTQRPLPELLFILLRRLERWWL